MAQLGCLAMVRRLLRRGQRGDAIVEFALVAPILLLIMFGILEVGRVVDAWIVVQNAAREGARTGALAPAATAGTAAQQAARHYMEISFASRTDVDSTNVRPPVVSGDAITVIAEANIQIYTPFLQTMLAPSVPVRASAVMPR
jgi:Flp pilus assembly protein TadG